MSFAQLRNRHSSACAELTEQEEDLSSDSHLKTTCSCTRLLVRVEWGEVGDGQSLGAQ